VSPKARHPREELKSIIAGDKPQYVKELFDTIAEDYDRMNWIMTGGLLALWHRAFLRQTRLAPGETALDVCCGTGDLTFLMARRVGPRGAVTGLDFSENMLAIARRRAEALAAKEPGKLAPITWTQGDALSLPFDDGDDDRGFAAVSMGFALRNVGDIVQALREMARVARRGGRIICLEVSRPKNPLLRAGFHIHFYRVVPILGRMAERRLPQQSPLRRLRPYTYLPYSLDHLPPPQGILSLMEEAGLIEARQIPLTGGVVSLYVGVKP